MAMNFRQYADAEGFAVIAYSLMPDHLHTLVKGQDAAADLRQFIKLWKQSTGFEWKNRTGVRLWQEGYFDHVLRPEEGDLFVIGYIAMNPVDAGLALTPVPFTSPYSAARSKLRRFLFATLFGSSMETSRMLT